MKRKLFSVLLGAFALLLLMGAGPAPVQEAPMLAEEESAELSAHALETDDQSRIEAEDGELPTETVVVPATRLVEITDDKLVINGVQAPLTLGKTYSKGVTYVALAPMAQLLDSTAKIAWDGASSTATVTTAKLKLTAKIGSPYVEANGRYLYLSEPIHGANGKVMLPLTVIAECFDAKVAWNGSTGVTTVTLGSGAILPGDQFYNQNDLFWLSRIIYAESGNQPLEGKMSVGTVVMNRVADPIYPNTVEGVLAQKNQFTTYKGGRLADRTPNASSVIAAKLVLDGGSVKKTEDALYFDSSANSWASRNRECIAVIGNHKFYN